jgi:RimJ/RimL family protein N-acetyltransferase
MRLKLGDTFEKQYFRRRIDGYQSPYVDPFDYRTVAEIGEDKVCMMMLPFVDDKSNPDQQAEARIEWQGLVDSDVCSPLLQSWLVAYQDDSPIGVVFPTRYEDVPDQGSLSTIGVFPQWQGKGYGKILHAKGLETLAKMGVTKYVGSTEVTNIPMIAVAVANGCVLTKIYKIKVDELGRHKPIGVVKEQAPSPY